jgi:hypothetical protein
MANEDSNEPPPPSPRRPQATWEPDPLWPQPHHVQRNPVIFESQPPVQASQSIGAGLEGVAAVGQASALAPKVSNAALSGASIVVSPPFIGSPELEEKPVPIEARFEALQARVALLEEGLAQVRRPAPIGPGHNQGPVFTPIEDFSTVDDLLLSLLKERDQHRRPIQGS